MSNFAQHPPDVRGLAALLADPFFAETLFDRLPDVVFFVKDKLGRYVVVNQTLVSRCGRGDKRDMLGRTPPELFPPKLGASYAAQDRQVLLRGQPIYNQLELHLSGRGEIVWCLTHKIPLRDHAENVVGLAGISRDLPLPDRDHPVYKRVAEVVVYIQQHYTEPLKLTRLAAMAGLSLKQLERQIQRIFDLTPKQLIIKTRLEAATDLLRRGADNVAAVAQACGYADHSAFSRQFKATVGLSPKEYREVAV